MFVASFIGRPPMNLIPVEGGVRLGSRSVSVGGYQIAVPQSHAASSAAVLGIPPLHIRPADDGLPAKVTGVEFFGSHRVVTFDSPAGILHAQFGRGLCVGVGEKVGLAFDTDHAVLFDAASERLMDSETTRRN
jgi:multiple sugar transport system ATP-binding protein